MSATGSRLMADPIDYSNISGSSINFNGTGGFTFTSTGSPSANIQMIDSTAVGLLGNISGSFTIGTVVVTPPPFPNPFHILPTSTASAGGTGSLVIYDGSTDLTATLTWGDIIQYGGGDALNDTASVDLTNIIYHGTNADLLSLASTGSGINVVTFQFTSQESLAQLKATNISTSFSGSMIAAVPDDGITGLLIGMGISGIALCMVVQRRRSVRG